MLGTQGVFFVYDINITNMTMYFTVLHGILACFYFFANIILSYFKEGKLNFLAIFY